MRIVRRKCSGMKPFIGMRRRTAMLDPSTPFMDGAVRFATALLVALLMISCGMTNQGQGSSAFIPPPPDLAKLRGIPGSCVSMAQSGTVTAAEQCWIRVLSARCAVGDDCLTACIASGKGTLIGGGCWHVCSQPPDLLANWKEPRAAARECKTLGVIPGYGARR